jgi:hypothetical protein
MASIPGTLNFPTSLDDIISLIEANNNASAALSAGINASALLIPVTQPSEFSQSGIVTILDSLINPTTIEIVNYTSKSGSNLVVPTPGGRGAQGTTPASFLAGAIVEQRPTARHHTVLADAIRALEAKIGYGTPLSPLDASGSNVAGANLEISGGRGTGSAEPGLIVARYPVRGSSGSTLQSMVTTPLPLPSLLWQAATATLISNTISVTSMLQGGATWATKTIQGGLSRPGTLYRIRIEGRINTTGTPNLQIRVNLGATTLLNTGAVATSTATNGWFVLEADVWVSTIGATGNVAASFRFTYTANQTNPVTLINWVLNSAAFTSINTTANQVLDVDAQWGTASASNSLDIRSSSILAMGL